MFNLNKRLILHPQKDKMTDYNDKQIQMLQVAEKLFAEKGFDGTSIREISKQANINVAMVSYYFGSKEKLLEAIMLYRTNDLKVQLEHLFEQKLTPIEKMEKYISLYIQKINSNKEIYKILNFEISSNKRTMDLQSFIAVKKGNLATLTKIIEEGQNQNIFKKDIRIALLSTTIIGTYIHFNNNKIYYKEILALDTDEKFNNYIQTDLIDHITQTINALLINEK